MSRWFLSFLLIITCALNGFAQTFIDVDLSASADITRTYSGTRSGNYCNDNNCIVFNVTLNSGSDLLSFTANQITGASFYTINCDDQIPSGTPACISGLTHVTISFCKPGNNGVSYTLTASSTVKASDDITLRQGCTGTLSVTGLTTASTTWTSIYPGAPGAYNSYLSCTSGCTSTNVTPAIGAPAYIDYRVSGTSTACQASRSDVVRVNTVPPLTVNINPSSAAICNGNPVTLSAIVTGGNQPYTYLWMKDGQSISQTTSSITVSAIGNYTVTVADQTANCSPVSQSATVTAAATPAAPTASNRKICNGEKTTLTATAPGGSYVWFDAASGGTRLAADASFTTQNLTSTATYYVQTTVDNCTSPRTPVTVTVNPIPAAPTVDGNRTICSGDRTTLTATAPGGNYKWFDSDGNLKSSDAVFTTLNLTNTTTYYVQTTVDDCTSARTPVTVTVKQTPNAPTVAGTTICSGDKATLKATAHGGTYNWYNTESGVTPLFTGGDTYVTDALTATTTFYVDATSAEGCTSRRTAVTVTVNQPADPAFNYSSNTFCKTGTNPVAFRESSSGGTFSASPAGLVFANNQTGEINLSASAAGSYTITFVTDACPSSSSVNITIINGPVATFSYNGPYCQKQTNPLPTLPAGSNAGIFSSADAGIVFTNSSTGEIDLQQSLPGTYTVRNDIAAANGCAATLAISTVTINPAPTVNAGLDQEVCSGQTVTLNGSIGGSASSAVWSGGTGFFSDPSSLQTAYTLGPNETNVTLYLTTNDPAGPCGAAVDKVHITVNPTPTITSLGSDIICSNEPQSYTIRSDVRDATFSWSRAAVTGISNPAVSEQISSSITEALINTTSDPIAVTYTIIPKTSSCTGAAFNYKVMVNPTPTITSAATDVICNERAQDYTIGSTVSNTTYIWSRAAVTNISNAAVSGQSSNQITETLINTSAKSVAVTYTIIPEANGCTGPAFNYTISVNPTPTISSDASANKCNEEAQNYLIKSNVDEATFTWSRAAVEGISNPTVTGQTGNTITEALVNTTFDPVVVKYVIIPVANGCTGIPFEYQVTVNPTPNISSAASYTICNNTAQDYEIKSKVNHATFSWSREAVAGISNAGVSAQKNNTITETLVNTTSAPVVVTYTIVPKANGCTGDAFQYEVTVNPTAVLSNTSLSQIVCSGESSVPVNLTSRLNGVNFDWTASATAGITGYTANGTNTIPAQTIVNAGQSSGTITYTVKPFYNDCEGTTGIYTITVNPKPAVPVASSNSPVCNGTALALKTLAVEDATYYWSGPHGFTSSIQNPEIPAATSAAAGTYSLTITVHGCTSDAGTTNVIINPIPTTPVAGSNGPVCAGEVLNLTASNIQGATYHWTGPDGFTSDQQNPVIDHAQITASGTYTVTATVNSCTSDAGTVNVVINPVPSAPSASSNSPICATTTLHLTANSISSATYSWTGPNGFTSTLQNPVIDNAPATASGTYTVTATINGCSSPAASVTVVVNPVPAAPVLSSNSPVCSGSSIAISCTNYEGATYHWTGPNGFTSDQQNPIINNAVTANEGRYIVIVTTPNCSVTNTAFIDVKVNQTPAAPVASSNSPVCIGQTLKLAATSISGAIYSWTGPNRFTSNLQNPEITNIDFKNAGIYTVTATVNGCTSAAGTITVSVNTPSVVTAGNDRTLCSDNPVVTLSGSITGSSTTGIWSTSGSGTFAAGNTNFRGIYLASAADIATGAVTLTLTATNTAPCDIASSSFKVTITPVPVVSAGDDQEVCINDEVILNGKIKNSDGGTWTSSGTGTFSPSSTSLDAHYIPSDKDRITGNVTLTLTAVGTCLVSDQMKVYFVPLPKVNAGADIYVLQGENITLEPAVSGISLKYSWTPNLYLNNNTLKNPVLTGTEDVTYTLTVTSLGGCTAQDQIVVKVLKPITIPNTFTPNGDGINDIWVIKELDSYPDATVKIFNRYGMQLFYSQGYGTPWNGLYNGQQLPVGTYYYIIDLKAYGKMRSGYVTIIR